jgi:hypothetical protein
MRLYIVTLALLAACCAMPGARTSEVRARTSLDVLADIIDPAYGLAMQSCVDSEGVAMRAGEMDAATPAQTEAALVIISARCHQVRDSFEQIRQYHERAISLVEDGSYAAALDQLDQLRVTWRELRERMASHDGG